MAVMVTRHNPQLNELSRRLVTTPGTSTSALITPAFCRAMPASRMASFWTAPIFEFLFPENAGTGNPIVPNNFQDMPFLAQGSGPLDGGPIVGQLQPWPGIPVPRWWPLPRARKQA